VADHFETRAHRVAEKARNSNTLFDADYSLTSACSPSSPLLNGAPSSTLTSPLHDALGLEARDAVADTASATVGEVSIASRRVACAPTAASWATSAEADRSIACDPRERQEVPRVAAQARLRERRQVPCSGFPGLVPTSGDLCASGRICALCRSPAVGVAEAPRI
jgi:hypothetical protein